MFHYWDIFLVTHSRARFTRILRIISPKYDAPPAHRLVTSLVSLLQPGSFRSHFNDYIPQVCYTACCTGWRLHRLVSCTQTRFARNFILFPQSMTHPMRTGWWLHRLICCSRTRFACNFILFPPSMIYHLHLRLVSPLVTLLQPGSLRSHFKDYIPQVWYTACSTGC